ncbi:gephyrin-like molybdotransferase Glp [Marisediminicola sp. LYQ134]|uniref:molybdopterin molybdotransferase MoeA n=1 Tax=unclassified Marisediminicola TaxID=2618316 RepID=UPI003983BBAA
MTTVAEHQEAVRALLAPLAARAHALPERIDLPSAHDRPPLGASSLAGSVSALLDRVLANDLVSPIDHPPFDNSQMDGYAVRSTEIVASRDVPVGPMIAAGHPIAALAAGTVSPIMTGAAMPAGADAVIPIEHATPDTFPAEGDALAAVRFATPPSPGAFVRERGSDLRAGAVLLPAGTRFGAAQCAVIAASGITSVEVVRRTRVLVISTGDELQMTGSALDHGRIYDANAASMAASVVGAGAEVVAVRSVTDDATELARILAVDAPLCDLVLTTGGVSAGAFEVVRDVFAPAGVAFGSVAMQPGGPQGLGLASIALAEGAVAGSAVVAGVTSGATSSATIDRPVIALPGNPVSALVSFEMFVRPALRAMHGLSVHRPSQRAPLAVAVDSPEHKHQVRRGVLADDGTVHLVGGPSSHLLHSYASSSHLVHIPAGVSHLAAGDTVEIWSIHD